MSGSGLPMMVTASGPRNANPTANAPLSVSVKMPFAATSCSRGRPPGSSPPRPARRTRSRSTGSCSGSGSGRCPPRRRRSRRGWPPERVRDDEHDPPVDPIDVDAGERREQDRRDEEGQEQRADRRRRSDTRRTRTSSAYRIMLIPIWVATCASHRRRNGRFRRTAIAEALDCGASVSARLPAATSAGSRPSGLRGARALDVGRSRSGAGPARPPRSSGVATGDELAEAGLEQAALEEHVAPAAPAAQADVGAEAIHLPLGWRRRDGRAEGRATSPRYSSRTGRAGHRRESIRGGVPHRSA